VTAHFMRDGGISDDEFLYILRDNPARFFGDRFATLTQHKH